MTLLHKTTTWWLNKLLAMARYIVSYRISRYWGRIVAYLYHDNYPSNKVDIAHNFHSLSASMPSMPSATSTRSLVQHGRSRQSDTNWQ